MSDVVPSRSRPSKSDLISRIRLKKGDLTQQNDIDAIVSSIGMDMNAGGSLNRAIMTAAGEHLDSFILEHIYRPRPGDAFALPAFNLPVKHILYVVTPDWYGGFEREDRDLLRCYRQILQLAHRMGLKSIAFPALGTGKGRYPVDRAARLAFQGIMERQTGQLEEIRIICSRDDVYDAFCKRKEKLRADKVSI